MRLEALVRVAGDLMMESLDLAEVKGCLDGLALEFLKGRFPNVDVEPYYQLAGGYVEERMRRDKRYKRDVESGSPLKTLISLTMDKVTSEYGFISGMKDEVRVNRLLKDFETMVRLPRKRGALNPLKWCAQRCIALRVRLWRR